MSAYDVLSDPEKRSSTTRSVRRTAVVCVSGPGGHVFTAVNSDLRRHIRGLFNRGGASIAARGHGNDVEVEVRASVDYSLRGVDVTLSVCNSSSAGAHLQGTRVPPRNAPVRWPHATARASSRTSHDCVAPTSLPACPREWLRSRDPFPTATEPSRAATKRSRSARGVPPGRRTALGSAQCQGAKRAVGARAAGRPVRDGAI